MSRDFEGGGGTSPRGLCAQGAIRMRGKSGNAVSLRAQHRDGSTNGAGPGAHAQVKHISLR